MIRHDLTLIALAILVSMLCPAFLSAQATGSGAEQIAVLESDADVFAKAKACQRLALIGDPYAAPALGKLLSDAQLSAYARAALETIGGPQAAQELVIAARQLDGKLLAGAVNSLGALRAPGASTLALCRKLVDGDDAALSAVALAALGRIATEGAASALQHALRGNSPSGRTSAARAGLECADRMLAAGQRGPAITLLARVRHAGVPEHVRVAAACRLMVVRQSHGIPILIEHLRTGGPAAWSATLGAIREMPGDDVTAALVDELPRVAPGAQVMIIHALTDRSKGVEWVPTVEPYLGAEDSPVRAAAANALTLAARRFADAGDAKRSAELLAMTASHPVDRATLAAAVSALRSRGVVVNLAAREGFITKWRLLGPVGTHDGLVDADAVSTGGPIDTSATVEFEGRTLAWGRWESDGSTGSVNFLQAIAQKADTAAYAYAEVVAPKARDILLKVGSDDSVYVWLNGELVHRNNTSRGVTVDEDVVEASLIAGTNTILAKVLNGAADWGLAVRLTDREGRPLALEQVDLPGEEPAEPVDVSSLEFVPLFDGETFDGWEGDTEGSFRIEDGAIVGGNLDTPIPRNEFLSVTRPYANFILRLECKLVDANGGIQIRSERVPDGAEMKGYQADMDSGGTYWGCLYDESRRGMLVQADAEETARIVKKDDWNSYEIRCEGPRIRLIVNGLQTVDYIETDGSIPLSGLIAVQVHAGAPSETWYRNITIAELP